MSLIRKTGFVCFLLIGFVILIGCPAEKNVSIENRLANACLKSDVFEQRHQLIPDEYCPCLVTDLMENPNVTPEMREAFVENWDSGFNLKPGDSLGPEQSRLFQAGLMAINHCIQKKIEMPE